MPVSDVSIDNRILAAIPREEYKHILPNLEPVRLPQGKVLYNTGDTIRHAYFLMSGVASLLSTSEDGSTIEVVMIGNEGLVGISAVLRVHTTPYEVVVQLPINAVRIKSEALNREFNRGGRLQDLLLRFTHTLLTQIAQSASCNRFHSVEERLCRWLLISSDRVRSDTLHVTQEFLSQMIGAPRTSVTMVASKVQKLMLIRYSRGNIQILDRPGLESFSCECYRIVKEEINHYWAA